MLKFGKLAKKEDKRNIKFTAILNLAQLPSLPTQYDVDSNYPFLIDNFMYRNDMYGDCVIAGRAHQTLRFEAFEQGVQIPITDSEVTTAYFNETGGMDSGLVMVTSLNYWRAGWIAAQKEHSIYAYAEVNPKNHSEVDYGIYLLHGIYCGFSVPQSAIDQFNAGEMWTVSNTNTNIVGGHAIYVFAFYPTGPVCMTWGRKQQMTWEFWDKYVDEAYVVVDNKDEWLGSSSPVDVEALDDLLHEVTNTPDVTEPPVPPKPTPTPSPCKVGNGAAKVGSAIAKLFRRKGRFYYLNPP